MYQQYYDQLGAYSLGLERLTGLQAKGGIIVCARRSGPPDVKVLDRLQLMASEDRFRTRFSEYLAMLDLGAAA